MFLRSQIIAGHLLKQRFVVTAVMNFMKLSNKEFKYQYAVNVDFNFNKQFLSYAIACYVGEKTHYTRHRQCSRCPNPVLRRCTEQFLLKCVLLYDMTSRVKLYTSKTMENVTLLFAVIIRILVYTSIHYCDCVSTCFKKALA